ncbi:MAG: cob(I)yrinic acid a,c-diamide adenosyltransferase [Burkholderiaceae bacterium]|nr:MAG: cob(I)yrinic acid a,c-diamide adenosyltransferase [Burkholderiaceae bacterium]
MSNDNDLNARHRTRMQRKKVIVDQHIAAATIDKGLLLVLTGNGKGKSSSAFGMAARALGHGMRVAVVQFIKSRTDCGEEAFFGKQPNLDWHVMGDGFTWDTQDRERDALKAQAAWEVARGYLRDPAVDLVVLDELTYTIKYRYLELETVLHDLQARPALQHVVVTGRGADPALLAIADTVTEMKPVKHAYAAGVRAQKGIEW